MAETKTGFWSREWAKFEERMLTEEARTQRRMPRFGKRWVVYHGVLTAWAVAELLQGDLLLPGVVTVYFLLEGSDALAELRRPAARELGGGGASDER